MPLVAGPLDATADAHGRGDFGRLLVDQHLDRHGVGVEVASHIADVTDGPPGERRVVEPGDAAHLAREDAAAGGDQRLHGDPRFRVTAQSLVENLVGDPVGQLVWVALRDRFGGEEPVAGALRRVRHDSPDRTNSAALATIGCDSSNRSWRRSSRLRPNPELLT